MVYSTKNYWFFRLIHRLKFRKHSVWELDLFPSSGDGETETHPFQLNCDVLNRVVRQLH
jgi:hypothetical protein